MKFFLTMNRQIYRKENSTKTNYGNSNEPTHKIQEQSFVAVADDSLLLEKELVPYDTAVRHCYFGLGELPEELKPFESELEDCEHLVLAIPRVKDKDGKIIRLLPAFLVPYKRYSIQMT